MVRCARCQFYCWIDSLDMLVEAAKCYDNGKVVEHDWRYGDGSKYVKGGLR